MFHHLKLKVLIVDDHPNDIRVASKVLGYLGFTVVSANDGQSALAEAERHKPDLIITDLRMPHMDGWQLMEHIKNNESLTGIPVILLTATPEEVSDSYAQAGFVSLMAKPIDIQQFSNDITAIINNQSTLSPSNR